MFIRGDSDAVNPLILRYSAGDQQCRDAGFLSSATLFRLWFLANKSHLPHAIFIDWRSRYLSAFFDGVASSLFTRSSADDSAITEQWFVGGNFTGGAYGKSHSMGTH